MRHLGPTRDGVVYDTAVLLAGERGDTRMRGLHTTLLRQHIRPVVPSVVLAQVWRGGPRHRLSWLLKGCVVEAFAENAAREVGRLLAASGTSDVVDAAVVVSAASGGHRVVTGDPQDLEHLAAALGVRLAVLAI